MRLSIFKTYNSTFWTANTMELFERMAWYGMFILLANYLTGPVEKGALGFSQSEKGLMMSTLAGLVYFLPILTGAIADRYGYKRMLLVSYAMMIVGYLLLSVFKTFWPIYFSFIWLAVGAACFKPVISATVSKTTNDENSSIGFGIFYMLVNIGAFIGPFIAAKLKVFSYDYVFYASAGIIFINILLLLFIFKEPVIVKTEENLQKTIKRIFRSIAQAMVDWKFLLFLVIIGLFWAMYFQLFYTFPVFIEQWVDLEQFFLDIQHLSPWLADLLGNGHGKIESEMLVNADAMYIVLFQVIVSALVMKLKPLHSMIAGIFICAIGIGLTVATLNPFFMLLSVFIFALGEMMSSPKVTEYIGKIAPKEKVALYMGFSFFPLFIGNVIAGVLSGPVYERISDKYSLLATELQANSMMLDIPSEGVRSAAYFQSAADAFGLSAEQLTESLYLKYQPDSIWMIFTGIGIFASISLFLYNRFLVKPS